MKHKSVKMCAVKRLKTVGIGYKADRHTVLGGPSYYVCAHTHVCVCVYVCACVQACMCVCVFL